MVVRLRHRGDGPMRRPRPALRLPLPGTRVSVSRLRRPRASLHPRTGGLRLCTRAWHRRGQFNVPVSNPRHILSTVLGLSIPDKHSLSGNSSEGDRA